MYHTDSLAIRSASTVPTRASSYGGIVRVTSFLKREQAIMQLAEWIGCAKETVCYAAAIHTTLSPTLSDVVSIV
jgi:hypothetical protein